MHFRHKIHSVPLILFRLLFVISTFIGQFISHFLQDVHILSSFFILNNEKYDTGFKNTATGQIYLQNALLS